MQHMTVLDTYSLHFNFYVIRIILWKDLSYIVQYDQSVLNDHYCQNRFTGGLAAVSQVAVIVHLSVMIKEDFLRFCGCTQVKSLNFVICLCLHILKQNPIIIGTASTCTFRR